MDGFAKDIPAFNLKGETQVSTVAGGIASCLILIIVFIYANVKFIQLYEGSNPVINEISMPEYYEATESLNLNEINFRMAFTVEGQFETERKDSQSYAKFLVRRLKLTADGEREESYLPYHECTEADYLQFYPLKTDSQKKFDDINSDEKRGFYCIDWEKEDLALGPSKLGNANYIDIMLTPCNYLGSKELGLTAESNIADECIGELDKQ